MRTSLFVSLAAFALAILPASPVLAQSEYVPGDQPTKKESEVDGWNGKLSIGGNVNLSSNQDVVGETDGFTALLGLSTNAALEYNSGPHQWENSFVLAESFARTPSLGQFVKNTDTLGLESLYQHYFLPWSGAFGQATFETTLFTTNNVTAEPSDYVVDRVDAPDETFTDTTELELAGPLSPTSISQSAGLFVKPVRKTPFTLMVRGGVGARESFTGNVLALEDDAATDVIEVTELRNVYQGGLEAFVGAQGEFPERNVTYKLGATGLLPVINNDAENRSALDLLRYGMTGQVTFNAFDWMSINYNMSILRDPQLIEKTQVQNTLLLNVKYSLVERRTAEKEEPTVEEKLKKARQKAEEAETRVEELEKKVEGEKENDEENGEEQKQNE